MKATSSVDLWKAVVTAAKTVIEEVTFTAAPTGIVLRAMDSSHAAMLDVFLPAQAFESYEAGAEEKFSVRLEDFGKVLGRAEKGDKVEIANGTAEEPEIQLKFIGERVREFGVHMISSAMEPKEIKLSQFAVVADFKKAPLEKIFGDASAVSDIVEIGAVKDKLSFSAKSQEGKMRQDVPASDSAVAKLEVTEEAKSRYSLSHIGAVLKAMGEMDYVSFKFSTKKPLQLEFKLDPLGSRVVFFMAPRAD